MVKPKASAMNNESLALYAKSRSEGVCVRLRKAMATIEKEIEEGGGIYPFNNGRLSMAEVCRRAGIHKITLQGEAHKNTTKVVLKEWLSRLESRMIVGSKAVRRRVADTVDDWKGRYDDLARSYNEMYAIEIVSRNTKLNEALAKITELEKEIIRLRAQCSSGRLLLMPQRIKNNENNE